MEKIEVKGRWDEIATSINSNFEKAQTQIFKLEDRYSKYCGVFESEIELKDAFPTADIGYFAHVKSGENFVVYNYSESGWVNTGIAGGPIVQEINIAKIPNASKDNSGLLSVAQYVKIEETYIDWM